MRGRRDHLRQGLDDLALGAVQVLELVLPTRPVRKLSVFGIECYCLGLDRLIQAKRDAGRPKHLEIIAELEALREE